MNNIMNDVAKHTVVAASIIGHDKVKNILREHFARTVSELELSHVDCYLLCLKEAIDKEHYAGAKRAAAATPETVSFDSFYRIMTDARECLGWQEHERIMRQCAGVTVPSHVKVQDVNKVIESLREVMKANTPTRKLLKEYERLAPLSSDVQEALLAFADWIDARATTAQKDQEGWDPQRYRK